MACVDWPTRQRAPSSEPLVQLGALLRRVVMRDAQRLKVRIVEEQLHVAAMGLDVIDDPPRRHEPLLHTEATQWLRSQVQRPES